jgi:hypothetical protein
MSTRALHWYCALNQINPVHTTQPYLTKVLFNIIHTLGLSPS